MIAGSTCRRTGTANWVFFPLPTAGRNAGNGNGPSNSRKNRATGNGRRTPLTWPICDDCRRASFRSRITNHKNNKPNEKGGCAMSSKTLRLGMGQKASSRSGTARTVGVGRGSSRGVEAVNFAALRQSAPPSLPARQAEVADLVAHGLCDCEIAAELGVTENTVGSYLKLIFKRYGVHT